MKQTKLNTCKLCGKHIDKSSIEDSWTTITISRTFVSEGDRYTLCSLCSLRTIQKAVMNEMDENLAEQLAEQLAESKVSQIIEGLNKNENKTNK